MCGCVCGDIGLVHCLPCCRHIFSDGSECTGINPLQVILLRNENTFFLAPFRINSQRKGKVAVYLSGGGRLNSTRQKLNQICPNMLVLPLNQHSAFCHMGKKQPTHAFITATVRIKGTYIYRYTIWTYRKWLTLICRPCCRLSRCSVDSGHLIAPRSYRVHHCRTLAGPS